jgi:glycosyltransferase involved in cell wall biosynthesis
MKIAIIPGAFFPDPGGAQVQAHNLSNIFNKKKIQSDILLLNKTNIKKKNYKIKYLNKFIINLVFIFDYYLNINLSFLLKIYLSQMIKKEKYQVWHFIFTNYKSLILINALNELSQKIVVTFQGADIQINNKIHYGNRLDKKYDKLFKKTLESIDKFTAISNNIKHDLIKLKIKKNKIVEIPNGIPLEKFLRIKIKKKPSKRLKIITVARYAIKKKGYDLVPKVVFHLNRLNVNFEWVIIGRDTHLLYENKCVYKNREKFKILNNLSSKEELYFPNSKIIKEYLKSDVYVNLSRIESFGITFVEALGANIPVITFDSKGANEIVKNNLNGFITRKKKVFLLCKKIAYFEKNKKKFKSNPLSSSKIYDLEFLYGKYLEIYRNLV